MGSKMGFEQSPSEAFEEVIKERRNDDFSKAGDIQNLESQSAYFLMYGGALLIHATTITPAIKPIVYKSVRVLLKGIQGIIGREVDVVSSRSRKSRRSRETKISLEEVPKKL